MLAYIKRLLRQAERIKELEESVDALTDALNQPHPICFTSTVLIDCGDHYRVFDEQRPLHKSHAQEVEGYVMGKRSIYARK